MDYYDEYNPNEVNNFDDDVNEIRNLKSLDRGYSKIYRKTEDKFGRLRNSKIDIYSSGGPGSSIRDAITGEYLTHKVGTIAEDLYFKLALSTNECKSKNGSNILFFSSPDECEHHLVFQIDETEKENWRLKKMECLKKLEKAKKPKISL